MNRRSARQPGRASAPVAAAATMALLLAPPAAVAADDEPAVTLDVDAFADGRPVSVYGYFRDYSGRLGKGSDGLLRSRFGITFSDGNLSVGYIQRYDYEIRASRDAALLYYRIRNDLPVAQDAPYEVEIDAYSNRRDGLQFGYRIDGANWSLTPKLALYRGLDLIDGRLSGVATADADHDFTYDASLDYLYRKDVLFERSFRAPEGTGLGLDLIGHWQPHARFDVDVALYDLAGWLWWRDVPGTRALATSQTADRDDQGRLTVRPTLNGVEFARDYAQRIHPEFQLGIGWALDAKTRIEASGRFTEVKPYGTLATARVVNTWLSLRAEVLPKQKAFGLGVTAGPLKLFVMSDSANYKRANVLSLRLGFVQAF